MDLKHDLGEVASDGDVTELTCVRDELDRCGPLVVLESFAAGTPVLGARRGGIAELVSDGVDGLLIPPEDVGAWASAIDKLAASPQHILRLRAGIRAPRTIIDVAHDMSELYRTLLPDAAAAAPRAAGAGSVSRPGSTANGVGC